MIKPFICFYGDKEECYRIIDECKVMIRHAFITDANADRLLITPRKHPSFICMIFGSNMSAGNKTARKIYNYSVKSRCPLYIIGSRRNFESIEKYMPSTLIQRSDSGIILSAIRGLCDYISDNADVRFAEMKSRFHNVAIISDEATSLALFENNISRSEAKPRIITSSARCREMEFDFLNSESLSGIITDKPLESNTLKLFESVSADGAPAVISGIKEKYGRKVKFVYLDSIFESDRIPRLIDEFNKKRSKLLFIRNKNKNN